MKRLRPEDQQKLTITLDLTTPEGRFAARALAYHIMPDNPKRASEILEDVGREG